MIYDSVTFVINITIKMTPNTTEPLRTFANFIES